MTVRQVCGGYEVWDYGLPVALVATKGEAMRLIKTMGGLGEYDG